MLTAKIIRGSHLNWGVKEGHSQEVKAYRKLLRWDQEVGNMELSGEYTRQKRVPMGKPKVGKRTDQCVWRTVSLGTVVKDDTRTCRV